MLENKILALMLESQKKQLLSEIREEDNESDSQRFLRRKRSGQEAGFKGSNSRKGKFRNSSLPEVSSDFEGAGKGNGAKKVVVESTADGNRVSGVDFGVGEEKLKKRFFGKTGVVSRINVVSEVEGGQRVAEIGIQRSKNSRKSSKSKNSAGRVKVRLKASSSKKGLHPKSTIAERRQRQKKNVKRQLKDPKTSKKSTTKKTISEHQKTQKNRKIGMEVIDPSTAYILKDLEIDQPPKNTQKMKFHKNPANSQKPPRRPPLSNSGIIGGVNSPNEASNSSASQDRTLKKLRNDDFFRASNNYSNTSSKRNRLISSQKSSQKRLNGHSRPKKFLKNSSQAVLKTAHKEWAKTPNIRSAGPSSVDKLKRGPRNLNFLAKSDVFESQNSGGFGVSSIKIGHQELPDSDVVDYEAFLKESTRAKKPISEFRVDDDFDRFESHGDYLEPPQPRSGANGANNQGIQDIGASTLTEMVKKSFDEIKVNAANGGEIDDFNSYKIIQKTKKINQRAFKRPEGSKNLQKRYGKKSSNRASPRRKIQKKGTKRTTGGIYNPQTLPKTPPRPGNQFAEIQAEVEIMTQNHEKELKKQQERHQRAAKQQQRRLVALRREQKLKKILALKNEENSAGINLSMKRLLKTLNGAQREAGNLFSRQRNQLKSAKLGGGISPFKGGSRPKRATRMSNTNRRGAWTRPQSSKQSKNGRNQDKNNFQKSQNYGGFRGYESAHHSRQPSGGIPDMNNKPSNARNQPEIDFEEEDQMLMNPKIYSIPSPGQELREGEDYQESSNPSSEVEKGPKMTQIQNYQIREKQNSKSSKKSSNRSRKTLSPPKMLKRGSFKEDFAQKAPKVQYLKIDQNGNLGPELMLEIDIKPPSNTPKLFAESLVIPDSRETKKSEKLENQFLSLKKSSRGTGNIAKEIMFDSFAENISKISIMNETCPKEEDLTLSLSPEKQLVLEGSELNLIPELLEGSNPTPKNALKPPKDARKAKIGQMSPKPKRRFIVIEDEENRIEGSQSGQNSSVEHEEPIRQSGNRLEVNSGVSASSQISGSEMGETTSEEEEEEEQESSGVQESGSSDDEDDVEPEIKTKEDEAEPKIVVFGEDGEVRKPDFVAKRGSLDARNERRRSKKRLSSKNRKNKKKRAKSVLLDKSDFEGDGEGVGGKEGPVGSGKQLDGLGNGSRGGMLMIMNFGENQVDLEESVTEVIKEVDLAAIEPSLCQKEQFSVLKIMESVKIENLLIVKESGRFDVDKVFERVIEPPLLFNRSECQFRVPQTIEKVKNLKIEKSSFLTLKPQNLALIHPLSITVSQYDHSIPQVLTKIPNLSRNITRQNYSFEQILEPINARIVTKSLHSYSKAQQMAKIEPTTIKKTKIQHKISQQIQPVPCQFIDKSTCSFAKGTILRARIPPSLLSTQNFRYRKSQKLVKTDQALKIEKSRETVLKTVNLKTVEHVFEKKSKFEKLKILRKVSVLPRTVEKGFKRLNQVQDLVVAPCLLKNVENCKILEMVDLVHFKSSLVVEKSRWNHLEAQSLRKTFCEVVSNQKIKFKKVVTLVQKPPILVKKDTQRISRDGKLITIPSLLIQKSTFKKIVSVQLVNPKNTPDHPNGPIVIQKSANSYKKAQKLQKIENQLIEKSTLKGSSKTIELLKPSGIELISKEKHSLIETQHLKTTPSLLKDTSTGQMLKEVKIASIPSLLVSRSKGALADVVIDLVKIPNLLREKSTLRHWEVVPVVRIPAQTARKWTCMVLELEKDFGDKDEDEAVSRQNQTLLDNSELLGDQSELNSSYFSGQMESPKPKPMHPLITRLDLKKRISRHMNTPLGSRASNASQILSKNTIIVNKETARMSEENSSDWSDSSSNEDKRADKTKLENLKTSGSPQKAEKSENEKNAEFNEKTAPRREYTYREEEVLSSDDDEDSDDSWSSSTDSKQPPKPQKAQKEPNQAFDKPSETQEGEEDQKKLAEEEKRPNDIKKNNEGDGVPGGGNSASPRQPLFSGIMGGDVDFDMDEDDDEEDSSYEFEQ